MVLADAEFKSENTIKKWLPLIEAGNLNTVTVIERVVNELQMTSSHLKEREQTRVQ